MRQMPAIVIAATTTTTTTNNKPARPHHFLIPHGASARRGPRLAEAHDGVDQRVELAALTRHRVAELVAHLFGRAGVAPVRHHVDAAGRHALGIAAEAAGRVKGVARSHRRPLYSPACSGRLAVALLPVMPFDLLAKRVSVPSVSRNKVARSSSPSNRPSFSRFQPVSNVARAAVASRRAVLRGSAEDVASRLDFPPPHEGVDLVGEQGNGVEPVGG
jgi:hypothetical protein